MVGSQSTQREPTETWEENANSTQKGPGQMLDLDPGPSYYEATVLTTLPMCCKFKKNKIKKSSESGQGS